MKEVPFSELNRKRCESAEGFNHKLESWSLSDWMTATLGELGEAANVIKKLNRIRDGIANTKGETEETLRAALADELADADIYLDLMYQRAGIDRATAVQRKFNHTSRLRGCMSFTIAALTRMKALVDDAAPEYVTAAEVAKNPDKHTMTEAEKAKDYVDGRFYAHEDAPHVAAVTEQEAAKLKEEWAKPSGIIPADPREAIHPPPQEFTPDEIATDPILRYFHYAHLPEKLRSRSAVFCSMAAIIVRTYPRNAERSVALRKLLEAKDAAVRASVEP